MSAPIRSEFTDYERRLLDEVSRKSQQLQLARVTLRNVRTYVRLICDAADGPAKLRILAECDDMVSRVLPQLDDRSAKKRKAKRGGR